LKFLLE